MNKKQQTARLFYEISKRENIPVSKLINDLKNELSRGAGRGFSALGFDQVKSCLLKRRYPFTRAAGADISAYLPKLEFKADEASFWPQSKFYPKQVYVEKSARGCVLSARFKKFFPKARFREIASMKEYLCQHRHFTIGAYNQRQDTVFILNESYDFLKPCPCTKSALGCGYHIFNSGFGCIYDCNYCFLQQYTNTSGIILPANLDRFFERFLAYKRPGMRIGSGQFQDSLALDNISEYSLPIAEFFSLHPEVTFEFKTKSTRVENLLKIAPPRNIVISWSLNPQPVIEDNEFNTPGLQSRLAAAVRSLEAGYRVGFHFDPVIYSAGWHKQYKGLIETVFAKVTAGKIAWISLGTLRFSPQLKPVIEKRFPANRILDEELTFGYDNKLRYPYRIRYAVYKDMLAWIRRYSRTLAVYLCMEEARMWKELLLTMPRWDVSCRKGRKK